MDREELARIFPLGPDSLRQPDVPRGRIEKRHFNTSRIFPGTVRDYWIYVPAQYRRTRPACLLVVQDGAAHLFRERCDFSIVLDNLIHQGAMPVTIGVFVDPGRVPARRPGDQPRDNRSFEYDSADDRYARFLLEELLPEVERDYRLRADGNSRAIMGGSSGAYCALNAAWERPDAFRRVVSMVGSYTPMRGGHALSSRVRVTAPKPLRVFLQGGAQDLNVACGDWWTANLAMLSALRYAGYEVRHAWDERAGHNEFHCSMIGPEALRYVWQDWPKPIRAGVGSRQPVARLLAPQRSWREITPAKAQVAALTVDAAGRICYADRGDGSIRRLDAAGRTTTLARGLAGATGLAWTADGRLLVARPAQRQVLAVRGPRRIDVLVGGPAAQSVAADATGHVYLAEPKRNRVMLLAPGGELRIATRAVTAPRQLALTPDGSQLLVAAETAEHVALGSILPDGGLGNLEPYFRLDLDEGAAARETTALAVSPPGWVAIATRAGLQFNLSNGLVTGFLRSPLAAPIDGITFAGAKRDQLTISCGGRIFSRRVKLLTDLWF